MHLVNSCNFDVTNRYFKFIYYVNLCRTQNPTHIMFVLIAVEAMELAKKCF